MTKKNKKRLIAFYVRTPISESDMRVRKALIQMIPWSQTRCTTRKGEKMAYGHDCSFGGRILANRFRNV